MKRTLTDMRFNGGWTIYPTEDQRVMIGRHNGGGGGYRTIVCDDATGWDYTGPAYPTKSEAFANVPRVAVEYYGVAEGEWECDGCGSLWETDPPIDGGPCQLCQEESEDEPCCIAFVTSSGRDHVPGCDY